MTLQQRLLIGFLSLGLLACQSNKEVYHTSALASPGAQPQNVIFLIGDGMGVSQISAAMYANNSALNMERFPVVGFHKTHAENDLITDSAAGATAFSCGIKTYNGAVGMKLDTTACKTIVEEAEDQGMATGLIATSTIVHATPAAFIAHRPLRSMYEGIAEDITHSGIDFFIGGGKRYFDRREMDDKNLYEDLQNKGYQLSHYMETPLQEIRPDITRNFAYFTADKHPLSVDAGRDYLEYATRLGVRHLSQRSNEGFFLMIEGSQIDWFGHANDGIGTIKEILDFDRAVGAALDFARRDKKTLVIVTSDHETGGFAINPGSDKKNLQIEFTTNGHTAALVPVFAYGPGAEQFSGIYQNTDIYQKLHRLLGFSKSIPPHTHAGK